MEKRRATIGAFGKSPKVKETVPATSGAGMDFPAAIKAVIGGKKVRSRAWAGKDVYGHRAQERLMLRLKDGQDHPWIVSDGDMLAVDWQVIL